MNKVIQRMELVDKKINQIYPKGTKPFDRKLASPKTLRDILNSYANILADRNEQLGGRIWPME